MGWEKQQGKGKGGEERETEMGVVSGSGWMVVQDYKDMTDGREESRGKPKSCECHYSVSSTASATTCYNNILFLKIQIPFGPSLPILLHSPLSAIYPFYIILFSFHSSHIPHAAAGTFILPNHLNMSISRQNLATPHQSPQFQSISPVHPTAAQPLISFFVSLSSLRLATPLSRPTSPLNVLSVSPSHPLYISVGTFPASQSDSPTPYEPSLIQLTRGNLGPPKHANVCHGHLFLGNTTCYTRVSTHLITMRLDLELIFF
ncbi:hypothetical protein BDQ17DRAFT_398416 [Cyathus striatus]|nr:hypothetical protein BDQ17DRAFT_398416 [Cyathus striatus]